MREDGRQLRFRLQIGKVVALLAHVRLGLTDAAERQHQIRLNHLRGELAIELKGGKQALLASHVRQLIGSRQRGRMIGHRKR